METREEMRARMPIHVLTEELLNHVGIRHLSADAKAYIAAGFNIGMDLARCAPEYAGALAVGLVRENPGPPSDDTFIEFIRAHPLTAVTEKA